MLFKQSLILQRLQRLSTTMSSHPLPPAILSTSKADAERFSRQLILPEFGVRSLRRLQSSRVLVVGLGGLGTSAAVHLASNGVGCLGLVDYDRISTNNLPRQITYRQSDVGQLKVDILSTICQQLCGSKTIVADRPEQLQRHLIAKYPIELDCQSAPQLVDQYDVVLDCCDNAKARYLLNRVCVESRRPLVSGAALKWDGQLTTFVADADSPCRACWWPASDRDESDCDSCSVDGVFGPLPGVIGTLQAIEALKIAGGMGASNSGRLLLFDSLAGQFREVRMPGKRDSCSVCGSGSGKLDFRPLGPLDLAVKQLCPDDSATVTKRRYRPAEFESIASNTILVDVRPESEIDLCKLDHATVWLSIDLIKRRPEKARQEFERQVRELLRARGEETGRRVGLLALCRRGNDSRRCMPILQALVDGLGGAEAEQCGLIGDVEGGLHAWSEQVDDTIPMY